MGYRISDINVPSDRFRYRAFISYSHADHGPARWLHRALESYRVPGRLVGRMTPTGLIERRIGKIFRDRDELPVAADLTGQINDALKETQFLIVLCSKASANSQWVNQEIINFKRLKGAASIIAVILDGEPGASGISGHEENECFAPALRFQVAADGTLTDNPAEPIAADLRSGKDTKRLAILKVIAGVLGLGLDELVRRENQRRARFLFWLSTAMATTTAVMAILTVMAFQARNDAERQKVQAEDLIEFMLGDLRGKLEPVGRLDVLDAVGDRALKYYSTLRPDELDPDTLGRRSRALHLIGEIQDLRGELDRALETFRSAGRTTEELLARFPNDGRRIFDQAQSEYWLGYVSFRKGDLAEADQAFGRYLTLAQHLLAIDPNREAWLKEAASAHNNLGIVRFKKGELKAALAELNAARSSFEQLAQSNPKDIQAQLSLAGALAWMADATRATGMVKDARNLRTEEIALYEAALQDDPKNETLKVVIANAQIALGQLDFDSGHAPASKKDFEDSLATLDELIKRDPSNTQWLDFHTRSHLGLAEVELALSNAAKSRQHLDVADAAARSLLARDSSVVDWIVVLDARGHLLRALLAANEGRSATALDQLAKLVADLTTLRTQYPGREDLPILLVRAQLAAGDTAAALKTTDVARDHWQAALTAIQSRDETLGNSLYTAVILDRLGQSAAARERALPICRAGLRRPEIAPLCDRYVPPGTVD